MTVSDNLELGSILRKEQGWNNKAILEMVYSKFPILKDRSKQRAGTLSGGEQADAGNWAGHSCQGQSFFSWMNFNGAGSASVNEIFQ